MGRIGSRRGRSGDSPASQTADEGGLLAGESGARRNDLTTDAVGQGTCPNCPGAGHTKQFPQSRMPGAADAAQWAGALARKLVGIGCRHRPSSAGLCGDGRQGGTGSLVVSLPGVAAQHEVGTHISARKP